VRLARTLCRAREERVMTYCSMCDEVATVRCTACGVPLCAGCADGPCPGLLPVVPAGANGFGWALPASL
jgi:hypothetical protein